jgi:hypothetical protein
MRKFFRLSSFRFRHEYFIILLPLFFVLHGYSDHYGEVPAEDALLLAGKYMLAVSLMTLLMALIFRSVRKGALFVVLFAGFYFFFGAVHDWGKDQLGENSFLVSYSFILPVSTLLFILLGVYLARTARSFNRVVRYLNWLLLVFLAVDGVLLSVKNAEAVPVAENPLPDKARSVWQQVACDTCKGPDIHLIIADEYTGSVALKEALQFDNAPFEDSLRRRGFKVVDSSRSNYNYTVASMASLFQMDYLSGLTGKPQAEVYRIGKSLINKNNFTDVLIAQGYTVKNFSVFRFGGMPPFEEPYFPQHSQLISGNTFFARVKRDIGYHAALSLRVGSELAKVKKALLYEAERERRKMDSVIREIRVAHKGPRFFYTHLMVPHPPYLIDQHGNLMRLESMLEQGRHRDEKVQYLRSLQYANKILVPFIDNILSASVQPPVIMLLSDHGLRRGGVPEKYHCSNLNAVYLPQGGSKEFYPGMSNVNQLRTLINIQFNAKLPLFPDSSILLNSKIMDQPLEGKFN